MTIAPFFNASRRKRPTVMELLDEGEIAFDSLVGIDGSCSEVRGYRDVVRPAGSPSSSRRLRSPTRPKCTS